MTESRDLTTQAVENQPPPLEDYDPFENDPALREALEREGGGWGAAAVREFGCEVATVRFQAWGRAANRYPPELRTHDRFGHRVDEVEFHPAWHEIMRTAMAAEVHNGPWRDPRPGANAVRSAKFYLLAQIEAGSCCPLTMTYASLPALRHQPEIAAEWEPRILGTVYDPRAISSVEKKSVLLGMAMTEKQGGSDVRANSTTAKLSEGEGAEAVYELTGHKWFCSAPMCDAFLTLAQTGRGLSCFLVERWPASDAPNPFHLQRLKEKLGNRSNASSEVEYAGTRARLLGEEGHGVATIIEMVHHTRLDCVVGSAGMMRQALSQAMHHATHRRAFGRTLREQPLMRNVLMDLALESEAALTLSLRLARAYDAGAEDAAEAAFARIATAVGKYWVCKRAPGMIYEAMECHGGNGYVEESILPRLYREAPVNAIWEGSGNVIVLDVLRSLVRHPETLEAFLAEIASARGGDRRLDRWLETLPDDLARPDEGAARRLVERMARALTASLLVRHAPAPVADAFCATRLSEDPGFTFGALAPNAACDEVLERAWPH